MTHILLILWLAPSVAGLGMAFLGHKNGLILFLSGFVWPLIIPVLAVSVIVRLTQWRLPCRSLTTRTWRD